MKDFAYEVKSAIESGGIDAFLEQYHADARLQVRYSNRPLHIARAAMEGNGKNSLEYIDSATRQHNIEIAFAGIIDGSGVVREFIHGEPGMSGHSDWNAGTLLSAAITKAQAIRGKITLGHSCTKDYGAICSDLEWSADAILFTRNTVMDEIAKSGLYREFGAEYSEMLVRSRHPGMSKQFWLVANNYAGVFTVEPKGVVIYHPWKIVT